MIDKSKVYWGNYIHMGGLSSTRPLKVYYDSNMQCYRTDHDHLGEFWEKLGLSKDGPSAKSVGFLSEDIEQTIAWMKGCAATMELLHEWSRGMMIAAEHFDDDEFEEEIESGTEPPVIELNRDHLKAVLQWMKDHAGACDNEGIGYRSGEYSTFPISHEEYMVLWLAVLKEGGVEEYWEDSRYFEDMFPETRHYFEYEGTQFVVVWITGQGDMNLIVFPHEFVPWDETKKVILK